MENKASPEAEAALPKPAGNRSNTINRMGYAAFTIFGLIQLIAGSDKINGAGMLGIALIFDPFGQSINFYKRPARQQAWLYVQVPLCSFHLPGPFWRNKATDRFQKPNHRLMVLKPRKESTCIWC
jgi:hypothetical protein